jgi:plastocyanin
MKTLRLGATLVASLALVALASAATASAQQPVPSQTVAINDFAFTPAELIVTAGTTVSWTNQQNVSHTTTANAATWDSSILRTGASFQFTFNTPGDFAYHCDIHPEMLGTIHVVADEATQPQAAPAVDSAPEPVVEDAVAPEAPAPVVPTPTNKSTYYGY